MADLLYTVIKTDEQYEKYCGIFEDLLSNGLANQAEKNKYELLQLLISDWERKHHDVNEIDPIQLTKSFMNDHGLNQTELAEIAGVGKSYMSEILNYKKKMSKDVIRRLATHFKIQQDALNKPYELDSKKKSKDNLVTI